MEQEGASGQITVFISLSMLCIFALLCCLTESARTAGARWYWQSSASSALDSVFSGYHRPLWDSYRLLFMEYENEQQIEEDYETYFTPYLEGSHWYPFRVSSIEVTNSISATDEQGTYFEQQILDYMNFGVWNGDFEVEEVDQIFQTLTGGQVVAEASSRYEAYGSEVLALEKIIETIGDSLEEQRELKSQLQGYLGEEKESKFYQKADDLADEFKKIPTLVEEYTKEADALAKILEAETMTSEQEEVLGSEVNQYGTYVNETGSYRQEIENLTMESTKNQEILTKVCTLVDEVEEDEEGNKDYGDASSHLNTLDITTLSFGYGIADKASEGTLQEIRNLCQGNLLELVLPEGMEVSRNSVTRRTIPESIEREVSLVDRVLLNLYTKQFFPNCIKEAASNEENSLDPIYELEYILAGQAYDSENLAQVVTNLVLVRQGLNLVHILSDSVKREAALNLGLAITGATGLTPLASVVAFFVMSVWALAEGVFDVRALLKGEKIPIVKNTAEWNLSLESLLTDGLNQDQTSVVSESGLSYSAWLSLLLLIGNPVEQEYRMMDMIEMNLRKEQETFTLEQSIYQVNVEINGEGKYVFFSIPFVGNLLNEKNFNYPVTFSVVNRY